MTSNDCVVKELSENCRTCMATNQGLTSLFSLLSISGKEESLDAILFKCTSMQVVLTDQLPHNICNSCLEKLINCYLFRNLCFDTQSKFLLVLEDQKQLDVSDSNATNCDEDTTYTTVCTDEIDAEDSALPIASSLVPDIENFNFTFDCDNIVKEDCTKNNFTCKICFKQCISKYTLNRHMKVHGDYKELQCYICEQRFTREADVRRHLVVHTKEQPYYCEICGKKFTQAGALSIHKRKNHDVPLEKNNGDAEKQKEKRTFLCSICGQFFGFSSTLKMHMRRHVGDKPFQCTYCELRFVSSARLTAHKRTHSGERPFSCNLCNANFAQATALTRHLKGHTNDRPHQCQHCQKRFYLPYELNIHLRQHTGERPLSCKICDRKFACPRTLKGHLRIHTDEKPHVCSLCGKKFRRGHHLKYHMKTHSRSSNYND